MSKDISITPASSVFVINDDVTQLHILAGLLCKEGFNVRTFESADAALLAMKHDNPPCLIVTCVYMPGIDGWCFCRLLRSPVYTNFNKIPILAVSAIFSGDQASIINSNLGADAFLPLPVDNKQFIDVVWALLNGEKSWSQPHVLIVEKDEQHSGILKKTFESEGYLADVVVSLWEARTAFKEKLYTVAVIDYSLPDGYGDELLGGCRIEQPDCISIIITADPTPELALAWMQQGAAAYIQKPFEPEYLIELSCRIRRERSLIRVEDLLEKRNKDLRESEKKYRELFENVPVGLYLSTLDGKIITANPACLDILRGKTADGNLRFVQDFWKSCIHPNDNERFWNLLLKQGYVKGFETSFNRWDGTLGWISNTAKIVHDKKGQQICISGSFTDITTRKQVEDFLQKKQDELQLLLDSVPAIIYYKDTANNVIRANNLWYKTLGFSHNMGEIVSLSEFLPNELADEFYDDDKEIVSSKEPKLKILEHVKTVCGMRWFLTDKVPYLDQNGNIVGIIGLSQDITERKEAEEALVEHEIFFQTVLKITADGFLVVDDKENIIETNEAYCAMSGYTKDEILKLSISDIDDIDDLPGRSARITRIIKNGSELFETRHRRKDGSVFDVEISVAYIDSNGDRLVSFCRDITARKQSEEALRASENKYHTLIEQLPDLVWNKNLEGIYVSCNQRYAQALGLTPGQIIGLSDDDLYPLELAAKYKTDDEKVISNGEILEVEEPWEFNGQTIIIRTIKTPLLDKDGKCVGTIGIAHDITERKYIEEKLRQREERHRTLLQTAMDGFWRVDLQGHLLEVNEAYCQMSGFSEQELLAMSISDLEAAETAADTTNHMKILIEQGDSRFETWHRRKDGSRFAVEISVQYKSAEGGYVVAFLRDISMRKQSELSIQENEVRLHRISSLISDIAYSCMSREDGKLSISWMMGAAERVSGYSIEEIKSKECWGFLVVEEDQPLFKENVIGLAPGAKGSCELRIRHKEGNLVWLASYAECVMGSVKSDILTLYGGLVDITGRKQANELLVKQQNEIQIILDSVPVLIFYKDTNNHVIRANALWYKTLGIPQGTNEKISLFEFLPKEKAVEFFEEDLEVISSGLPNRKIVESVKTVDGLRWFLTDKVPFRDQDGNVIGIIGLSQDITTQKLAEEELHLKSLVLDQIRDHVTITNLDGVITYVNQAETETFGYPKRDIIGKSIEIYGEDTEQGAAQTEILEKTLRDGTWRGEVVNYSINGSEHIMDCRTQVIYDGIGNPLALAGIATDITERKQAEEKLKSAYMKLEALWDITSIAGADFKTICDHVLKTIVQMTGSQYGFYGFINQDESIMTIHSWSGEAMIDCTIMEKPQNFIISETGVWAEAVRKREPLILNNYASYHPAKKGCPEGHVPLTKLLAVPFFAHGRIITLAAVANRVTNYTQEDINQITAFLMSIQTITERMEAEVALKESEGRFRLTFDQSPVGSALIGLDYRFIRVNDALCKITGYSSEELIQLHFTDITYPDDILPNVELAKRLVKGEIDGFDIEKRYICKKGDFVWVHAYVRIMKDVAGDPLYYLTTVVDITHRKKAERERDYLQEQLLQAQKMEAIGTLAGGIAHDFNNILGCIIGNAELAMYEVLPPESEIPEYLDMIMKATSRAKDLVAQILTFSRKSEDEKQPVRVDLIIKESLKMLRSSLPSTIEIRQDFSSGSATVLGNATQIHQVVVNLCTNAAHAMREKGGILDVRLSQEYIAPVTDISNGRLPSGSYLRLMVSDTGVGIDPSIVGRIFEPFFSTKPKHEGTGLGLAVVHGIIRSHRGSITVQSELRKGTSFHILLPLLENVTEAATETAPLRYGKGERILLIDDEEDLLWIGEKMLTQFGYQVTTQSNSLDALGMFSINPDRFDLIVTDETMPKMKGSELAQELLLIRPDIPIILCTGYSDMIFPDKGKSIGLKDLIKKPVSWPDLINLIADVLGNRD